MSTSPTRPPVPPRSGRPPLLPQQPLQQKRTTTTTTSHNNPLTPSTVPTDHLQKSATSTTAPPHNIAASSPPHIFNPAYFRSPQFCLHCSDFIWGAGNRRGVHCSRCRQSLHRECAPLAVKTIPCHQGGNSSSMMPDVYAEDFPIDQWTVDLILQWLAATNLFLYADHFRANLGTLKSLRHLDAESLRRWRIHNEDHRLAILLAVDLLFVGEDAAIAGHYQQQQQQRPPSREEMALRSLWNSPGPYVGRDLVFQPESHRLTTTTFGGKPSACFKCGIVLWGLVKQGLKCLDCGRGFHRTCAATGLPKCCPTAQQPGGVESPFGGGLAAPPFYINGGNAVFGTALSDLPLQYLTTALAAGRGGGGGGGVGQQQPTSASYPTPENVPFVVFLCANELERRGKSDRLDLFQIYDNPSHERPTEDLVTCFKRCHNPQSFQQMTEHVQSVADPKAIAGCLQRFLLDLPSPVFPANLFPHLLQIIPSLSGGGGGGGGGSKISSAPRKFLRNLLDVGGKDSHLPPQHPAAPSSAASSSSSSEDNPWHPVHRSTFRFLMAHLCRVWSIQARLSLIRDEPPTQLVSAFSTLLIAPAWPDICQIVAVKSALTALVETLLFEFDWGEDIRELVAFVRSLKPPPPPSRPVPVAQQQQQQQQPQNPLPPPQRHKPHISSSPSKPPSSLSSTPPSAQGQTQQQQLQQPQLQQRPYNNNNPSPIPHQGTPLAGCSCYWGSISRDDANNLLKGTTDGTFLLRDSFRDPLIPYALHVQFHGQSLPVQVLVSAEGKYGFADRNLFHDSVFHLIDYHKTVSLEEFNRELKDLKLIKPLVRKSRPPPSQLGGGSVVDESSAVEMENPDPKLSSQLLEIHAKWLVKQNDHDEKYEEHAEVMSRLQDNKQALEAFRQTVLIYKHQADLHKKMAGELESEADRVTMEENFQMLQRSLKEVESERAKLEKRNEEDAKLIRQLANHINQLKPEIGALMAQKQELIRQLTQASYSSCNNEMIEEIFREAFRSLWYWENFTREHAIDVLREKRDGTFLIRPSGHQVGNFSLSIVHSGRVMHARIEQHARHSPYGGVAEYVYCFDEKYMFPSLDLMVQHYYRKSLKDHNAQLDTFLKYPVGYYLNFSSTLGDDDADPSDAEAVPPPK